MSVFDGAAAILVGAFGGGETFTLRRAGHADASFDGIWTEKYRPSDLGEISETDMTGSALDAATADLGDAELDDEARIVRVRTGVSYRIRSAQPDDTLGLTRLILRRDARGN